MTSSPQVKLSSAFLFLMAFSAWIVAQSFSIEITRLIFFLFGFDSANVQMVLSQGTKNEDLIRLTYSILLPVNQILSFGILGYLFAWLSGFTLRQNLLINAKNRYHLLLIPFTTILIVPLLQFLIWDSQTFHLPESYQAIENQLKQIEQQTKELQSVVINNYFLIVLLIMAILPAICEELFFRFFLLNNFKQSMSTTWAIIINGLLFSFIHFQVYGFFARWALGSFFAWATIRSGSILPAILAHFTNNALMVIFAFLAANNQIDKSFADENFQFPMLISIFALLAFSSIIYYIEKKSLTNGQKSTE